MALAAEKSQPTKRTSPIVQVTAIVAATAIAAGIGWYTGDYLQSRLPAASDPITQEADMASTALPSQLRAASRVVELDPITTNLAMPVDVWVRLEVALAFESEPDTIMVHEIHEDLLAYMRTVQLRQIETPSGFQHLKTDLTERASVRSKGQVKEVLIKTLLYE